MDPAKDCGKKKKKKEMCESVGAATPAGVNTMHFLQNTFLSCIKNAAFVWVPDCCKKGIPVG